MCPQKYYGGVYKMIDTENMVNTDTGNKLALLENGVYVELDANDEIVATWNCPDEYTSEQIESHKRIGRRNNYLTDYEEATSGKSNPLPDHW